MSFLRTALLLCLLICVCVPAAWAEKDVDGLEVLLPHHETERERAAWLGLEDQMPNLQLRDNPPPGPVRNCAEWEPATGVLIRYPLGLPYSLLRDLDDDVKLHVVVASNYQTTAQNNLNSNGIDMSKVEFLVKNNDSIWTRDYGPWYIFDGNNDLAIVNHTYNRPYRPNDNAIPLHFGQQQGVPVYSHSMYHAGGNYMTDGSHISASTRLVYDEASDANSMSEREVDALMTEYYGLSNYTVIDYIESGGIHHIDTMAKFLDEETVLVKKVWPGHHTYDELEQHAILLASLTASTGRNYRVFRVTCHDIGYDDPASYTNSLILNDHIYVPIFNHAVNDAAALEVYREAAPGYTVSGYYHSGFITDDALHCRTKGVLDTGMLRVDHIPVLEDTEGDTQISATVKAYSGQAINDATVHYRHNDGTWQSLTMNNVVDDRYTTLIPEPAVAATCDYYVSFGDASGRVQGRPRTMPVAFYSFYHSPDTTPVPDDQLPLAVSGDSVFPNPFNPQTTFSFELGYAENVKLTVVDMRGRIVRVLANETLGAGKHDYVWDGKSQDGQSVASGVYLFRLNAAGLNYSRAATLLK